MIEFISAVWSVPGWASILVAGLLVGEFFLSRLSLAYTQHPPPPLWSARIVFVTAAFMGCAFWLSLISEQVTEAEPEQVSRLVSRLLMWFGFSVALAIGSLKPLAKVLQFLKGLDK